MKDNLPCPSKPTTEEFAEFVRLCVEISALPLTDWLDQLNHGEVVGVVLDPTLLTRQGEIAALVRRHLPSAKAQFLKNLIGDCLAIKARVNEARNDPRIWQEFLAEMDPDSPRIEVVDAAADGGVVG